MLRTTKIRTLVLAAAATVAAGTAVWTVPHASAQAFWDVVHVTLPYTVTIGEKTLPPGDYTIQQLHEPGSPVMLIYSGDGMKFETSALTIHAIDRVTPENTSVVLHHIGDDYYFDKIWIQGKDDGYEFPLPAKVRDREKELAKVSVPAQSSPAATAAVTTTPVATPPAADFTSAEPQTPDNEPAAPVAADNTPVPPPAPEPAMAPTDAEPQAEPQASAETPQQPATPPPDNSANREKQPAGDDAGNAPKMPATSAGWLAMLLGGGTLSGAGMMLRRKR
jgi:hypothetical protein